MTGVLETAQEIYFKKDGIIFDAYEVWFNGNIVWQKDGIVEVDPYLYLNQQGNYKTDIIVTEPEIKRDFVVISNTDWEFK